MVYAGAARKTLGYIVVASVLGLSVVTLLSGDPVPTARVIDSAGGASDWSWLMFALGMLTGALMAGTYVYVAHLEARR